MQGGDHVEDKDHNQETGELRISPEAIAVIASTAVMQVKGVSALATGRMEDLTERVGMRNPGKGLRLEIKNNTVSIDVHIIVHFGCRIPDVARSIQKTVKGAIEQMTDLHVTAVNVLVQGIDFSGTQERLISED
ncbi:MAG TPA: Asp23/Gls24 family envelope stress response protein [Peptococcaceae bacterium]|nr:Asp23/Gls24 family envelope stress response protein [Peptococcaceae bacterium]